MGYVLNREGMERVFAALAERYRLYAPVRKVGEGRAADTDVIRYDYVHSPSEIELDEKSEYSFKEILTPLSRTLFFFTENEVKEADTDGRPVLVFLRSCDMHAVMRLDQIYLKNGRDTDYFYQQVREKVSFVLLGCTQSFDTCFCADMGTNRTEHGYVFSLDKDGSGFRCDVPEASLQEVFAANSTSEEEVVPAYVTENPVHVTVPETVPNAVYRHPFWEEYNARCIGCGRCNFVCPTCTCFTMQDVYYTDNGKVGERRRVGASCMVDGYTNVAGGGEYRRTKGERMRFKTLHKVWDFRKRFGYDMCVGCGRCDMTCPEYISFPAVINKLNGAVEELKKEADEK